MRVMIEGQDLVAWTLSAALASTGCRVSVSADRLPRDNQEVNEPDLLRLLDSQHQSGRLQTGYPDTRASLLVIGRDMGGFESCCRYLEPYLSAALDDDGYLKVIALVQPLPLGTTDRLQQWLQDSGRGQVKVVYWPAFIQAGRALESLMRPERILLGSCDEGAIQFMRQLLNPFNRSRDTLMVMPPKEAELSKLAINGMLATRVSFMNELAQLAADKGIDIEQVRQGIGSDTRIGFQYLYPGCGFGGQAFLKTLAQLSGELEQRDTEGVSLLRSVCSINEQQKDLLFQKLWRFYRADLAGKRVAIWGCAFKPNTASVEGSPALTLVEALLAHDVELAVYDPRALPALRRHLGERAGVVYADSPEQAAEGADALMLVTEWKEFWNLDMQALQQRMRRPLLLDGRNIYDPAAMELQGWTYSAVGRGVNL
ncbi:nucleotide sugar dehydrogenase [Marinobacterium marinum]|uniref:UDP-glucose 6-dehydrogenase n=1 Tax=Marinobacterium marinum TaxID=2756129 RepID=A0A7W2AA53_9GAMM|nr:nucleotide sugar dehydrogenase [Marinobacterium marinum]MBA4501506.1 UDP-glucose/GDP-mannose dehydrogenase family protein [Marinobacterium marinum]